MICGWKIHPESTDIAYPVEWEEVATTVLRKVENGHPKFDRTEMIRHTIPTHLPNLYLLYLWLWIHETFVFVYGFATHLHFKTSWKDSQKDSNMDSQKDSQKDSQQDQNRIKYYL